MKRLIHFAAIPCLIWLMGCAHSSVQSRKQERYGTYTSLEQETRALVDEGKIARGMPMDAVYIAWGKPAEVLESEGPEGRVTTWLYHGTHFEEYRYWSYRASYLDGYHPSPYLETDYLPRTYVEAEVQFQEGKVLRWRTLPRPTY